MYVECRTLSPVDLRGAADRLWVRSGHAPWRPPCFLPLRAESAAVVVGCVVVVVGGVEVGTPGKVVVEAEVFKVVDEVAAFGDRPREDTALTS